MLDSAIRFPGYRRQLLARFNGWSRAEWSLDGPKPDPSPVGLEEFAIFGHYRATLFEAGTEDAEGWSVWMSKALERKPPPALARPGQVVVIDPVAPSLAAWRLIDHCARKARSMIVTLPFDPDPTLEDLYASVEPIRKRFLSGGFIEEVEPTRGLLFRRPAGLEAVERELFRSDLPVDSPLKVGQDAGLKILGGPKGEGVALLVAREVRRMLESGVDPEEILILAPRLDEDTERIREALRAWGLPVDRGKPRALASIPAVSALRLALRLPVDDWETATLASLLRNGQLGRKTRESTEPFGRFEAASSLLQTRVFRDRQALVDALKRAAADPKSRNLRAKEALRRLEPLLAAVDSVVGRGTWRVQVDRLRHLAELLEIDPTELEPLGDALDDQAEVRDRLGATSADRVWSWAEFVSQVDSTVQSLELPRPAADPGTIRIESVAAAEAVRARRVILTGLAEQTFPGSDAIDLDRLNDRVSLAYSREMFRFARVAGSAEDHLTLAFPTSDSSGEKLLPAAFLDDLIRRLPGDDSKACLELHNRFDPVLIRHAELAQAPSDARVLAMARACQQGDLGSLRDLARHPEHAEALQGAADAFEVAQHRRGERSFGPFDGRLSDPRAIDRIRQKFGANHTFSASQLESFALCPFQFYQRYVLGLRMVDERQELDEDYAGRGEDVHRVLEQVHRQAAEEQPANLIERLTILIETQMRVELEQHDDQGTNVPAILRKISTLRTRKALERYLGQYKHYSGNAGSSAIPHKFEVVFGQAAVGEETADSRPVLTIGEAENSLKLQGKIDRIDLVSVNGRDSFRVIDYKTGSNPPTLDVKSGLASQLPLYALAVERLLFPDGSHLLADFGYWKLRDDGFKPVKLKEDWEDYRTRLEDFLIELVGRLRDGAFPVASLKSECGKHCDFKASCRVSEVRFVRKKWDDRPTMGSNT